MVSKASLVFAALLTAACASGPRTYTPTESQTARSTEGIAAAQYALIGRNGQFGEAKLWSRGARAESDRTLLHLAVSLENSGTEPISLSELELDWRNGQAVRPAEQTGPASIEPDSTGIYNVVFALAGTDVDALADFRVRWRVTGNSVAFGQQTPFVSDGERRRHRYRVVSHHYSPHYYPYGYIALRSHSRFHRPYYHRVRRRPHVRYRRYRRR